MFDRVSHLLGLKPKHHSHHDGLALATAALLVQVSKADGDFSADERALLLGCLEDQFNLESDIADEILARAEREQDDAASLYVFTRAVTRELDQDGRQEIVRLLWRVAFADNQIDNFEENALAKIAGLLGVTAHDRIRLKHEVMAE
ncbi:TerB family tellurite resistance protein [Kordiimonas marina]|uniref:tellurite resistance TerB family protein n=1 Tax=Kordiimonas marina TaxID=2872312 RepID=UPI001FF59086|nr:TerB family tellurite resistance protein [Kordiimonas marina]MCJ9428302.1 TerB family tellurite resistance protein [Kordiimonas marina]